MRTVIDVVGVNTIRKRQEMLDAVADATGLEFIHYDQEQHLYTVRNPGSTTALRVRAKHLATFLTGYVMASQKAQGTNTVLTHLLGELTEPS